MTTIQLFRKNISKEITIILVLIIINLHTFFKFSNELKELNKEFQLLERKQTDLGISLELCRTEVARPTEPSLLYEKKRRRIRSTLQYMWDTIKTKIPPIRAQLKDKQNLLDDLYKSIYEHKISILSDWNQMTANDGFGDWRKIEAKKLEELVQKRFHYLQNPENCKTAKIFHSYSGRKCGWGCQFTQYAEQLSIAYGLRRTLIYTKPADQFYEADEYSRYYLPISESCTTIDPKEPEVDWPGTNDTRILKSAKDFRNEKPRIPFLFTAVPSDLLARLEKVFEEPQTWWISQIDKYLLRLNAETQKLVDESVKKLGFQRPIAAIHVRRGNKKTEVPYQMLSEYMDYVNEYFDVMELTEPVKQRRVYIVTDEPAVVKEAREKYANYEILTNLDEKAQDYQKVNTSSLDLIIQGRLVSMADYYVFTMSSNLGRKFYEFFHWNHIDAKERIKSLDWREFEDFEGHQYYRVVMKHIPTNKYEIPAEVGDLVDIHRFDNRGIMTVIEGRKSLGVLPSFKLDRIPNTAEFAKYDDIA